MAHGGLHPVSYTHLDEEQTTYEEQVTEKANTNKVPVGQIAVGAVIRCV